MNRLACPRCNHDVTHIPAGRVTCPSCSMVWQPVGVTLHAVDTAGTTVKQCKLASNFEATTAYKLVTNGDASTHGGVVVGWEIRDRYGHLVDKVAAPGYGTG